MTALLVLSSLASAQTFTNETSVWVPTGLSGGQAHWADIDGDGYPELHDYGIVYDNDGTTLTRSFAIWNYAFGGWADTDNDGDLDFVSWYDPDVTLYVNDGSGSFTADSNTLDLSIVSCRGVALADFDGDSFVDAWYTGYEGAGYEPDRIAWNNSGSFTSSTRMEQGFRRPGRGVTAADFDEDGDIDVYVSNYRLERNGLYVNDGAGNFVDRAKYHRVQGTDDGWYYSYGHTIGSSWGDLDNDGYIDLFVGNFSHAAPYQDRPKFYRNRGPDHGWQFADLSAYVGIERQESFASPTLGDYDNDGDLDLYFTTVYSGDFPVLLRNDGNWTFTDVTNLEGLTGIPATYQAAWADIDDDGDLDLITGARIYENHTTGKAWLKLNLVGDGVTTNTTALGAQARITVGSSIQTRQVESGTGEGNANDLTLHFGFGSHALPVMVEVFWPDGTTVSYGPYDLNQTVTISQ